MFVNKRVLNEQGVETREQLESCKHRCSNKAVHLKNGVLLCTRHKDTDISKIEDIINGVKPNIVTKDVIDEVRTIVEEGPLKAGEYSRKKKPTDVEGLIEHCCDLTTMLENSDKVVPCRIGFKEVCLLNYNGLYYVVDPVGECLGKITNEDKLSEFELKMKMKEYFDITGVIESLVGESDRNFLENFSLSYNTNYQ